MWSVNDTIQYFLSISYCCILNCTANTDVSFMDLRPKTRYFSFGFFDQHSGVDMQQRCLARITPGTFQLYGTCLKSLGRSDTLSLRVKHLIGLIIPPGAESVIFALLDLTKEPPSLNMFVPDELVA